jgi:myo-inositol catabolism protein IolC
MNKDVRLFAKWFLSRPENLAKNYIDQVDTKEEEISNLKVMILSLRGQLKKCWKECSEEELKVEALKNRTEKLRAINEYAHHPNNVAKVKMLNTIIRG